MTCFILQLLLGILLFVALLFLQIIRSSKIGGRLDILEKSISEQTLFKTVILAMLAFISSVHPLLLFTIAGAIAWCGWRKPMEAPQIRTEFSDKNYWDPHPCITIAASGLIAFAIAAILFSVRTSPPEVHDEFSYLLAADTFRQGRFSNPIHPLWVHFESFHVLHHPSYASKFPPGQAILLAIAWVLFGHPIWGGAIGMGLSAASCCWAVQQSDVKKWGLLSGAVVGCNATLQQIWGIRYWGGQLPLLGSALMAGATFRLLQGAAVTPSLVFGAGFFIMGISRPYEAVLTTFVLVTVIIIQYLRNKSLWKGALVRVAIPGGIMFAGFVMFTIWYNINVTYNCFRLPYIEYSKQYEVAPFFLWGTVSIAPSYRHDVLRTFFTEWAMRPFFDQQTISGLIKFKSGFLWSTIINLPTCFLTTVGLFALLNVRRFNVLFSLSMLFFGFIICIPVTWAQPRYVAQCIPFGLLVIMYGLQTIMTSGGRSGRTIATGLVTSYFLVNLALLGLYLAYPQQTFGADRQRLLEKLNQAPGQHLVVVQYGENHDPLQEWVYNEANIDGSKVVFARLMDIEQNQKLFAYYPDRYVWLLRVNEPELQLTRMGRFRERRDMATAIEKICKISKKSDVVGDGLRGNGIAAMRAESR